MKISCLDKYALFNRAQSIKLFNSSLHLEQIETPTTHFSLFE